MRSQITGAALLGASLLALARPADAQYNAVAGRSAPMVSMPTRHRAADGTITVEQREVRPTADRYGNAAGTQFDLAVDGAFEGETVAVLHFYTGENFDFALPRAALREKGFSVYRWSNGAPPLAEFRAGLARASQLWIISDATRHLDEAHLRAIQDFYEAGHGVYIWGDNEPYYADANAVAERLFHTEMAGNLPGAQVVNLQRTALAGGIGLARDHLLTTGIEQLYEGITIATLRPSANLQPLLYGSAGNLVTAYHDRDGRRAIVDGGFTRLFIHWDTAGTARYVKNAAAWLANAERFGTARTPGRAPLIAPTPSVNPLVAPRPAPAVSEAPAPQRREWREAAWALVSGGVLAIAATVRGRKDPRGRA